MKLNKTAEALADLIEKNPNCQFDIDNDIWYIVKQESTPDGGDSSITNSDEFEWTTEWYSNSNLYGAGLAEALVILLNRRGFNIKAQAV